MNTQKADRIIEIIRDRGYNAETTFKDVNGVQELGITIGDGDVRPCFYPKFDTNDYKSIADNLIKNYEKHKDTPPILDNIAERFTDFNYIKDNIIPCLVKEAADDVVSRNYLDLKVVYRYMIGNREASILIKKNHLDMWDITEDELFDIAKANVKDSFTDVGIGEMTSIPFESMRVVTTQWNNYGASSLLFPELFEKYGNDARLLPSSIHEIIVVTADAAKDSKTKMFVDMITSVNRTELLPQDILSDHPYAWEDGEIREVL